MAGLLIAAWMSRTGTAPGLKSGQLTECKGSPNCVCSEYDADSRFWVEPISIEADKQIVWNKLRGAVKEMGGDITNETPIYLSAVFSSKWLHFKDDFEARFDEQANLTHLRSASRVGYSDLGVNNARIARLKVMLNQKLAATSRIN